jgi:uncharacterized protein YndB with AHSA1/START domain
VAKNISTIILNATLNKIWDVLTKPEFVKQWQYGSDLITDWKVGSEIRFRTEWKGQVFEQWGKILEVVPQKLIRYSLFAPRPGLEDKPENYFVMNYIINEEKNSIRLDIIQEDNRPGAVQEAPQGEENPVLKALKDLIEF